MNEERLLAENTFISFVKTVHTLLIKENIHFDLLLGAGDSGSAMVKYVELVYTHLGLPLPVTLVLPTYRHSDEEETIAFDNQVFVSDVRETLKNTVRLNTILFVDDEIGSGSMANAMLELVLTVSSEKSSQSLRCFIAAEDHGFHPDSLGNKVEIVFRPFAKKKDSLWSIVLRLPEEKVLRKISEIIPRNENVYKYATNILLDLPVKEFGKERPAFTHKYNVLANTEFKELPVWRSGFKDYLNTLIAKAIQAQD